MFEHLLSCGHGATGTALGFVAGVLLTMWLTVGALNRRGIAPPARECPECQGKGGEVHNGGYRAERIFKACHCCGETRACRACHGAGGRYLGDPGVGWRDVGPLPCLPWKGGAL